MKTKEKNQVLFIYDKNVILELSKIEHIKNRAQLVFELIKSYDLFNEMTVTRSTPAMYEELVEFHSTLYIDSIRDIKTQKEEDLEEIGLTGDCPILDDMYSFISHVAGSSLTAAKGLISGKYQFAINWCGGWHHSQKCTGKGKYYTANVPFQSGTSDKSYLRVFYSVIKVIQETYQPDCLVVQCGADSLARDELGDFNVSSEAFGTVISHLVSWSLPSLFLGGGGYNVYNTARYWTYLTSIITSTPISTDIPDECEDFSCYGPDFTLPISSSYGRRDENREEELSKIIATLVHNVANYVTPPPGKVECLGEHIAEKGKVYGQLESSSQIIVPSEKGKVCGQGESGRQIVRKMQENLPVGEVGKTNCKQLEGGHLILDRTPKSPNHLLKEEVGKVESQQLENSHHIVDKMTEKSPTLSPIREIGCVKENSIHTNETHIPQSRPVDAADVEEACKENGAEILNIMETNVGEGNFTRIGSKENSDSQSKKENNSDSQKETDSNTACDSYSKQENDRESTVETNATGLPKQSESQIDLTSIANSELNTSIEKSDHKHHNPPSLLEKANSPSVKASIAPTVSNEVFDLVDENSPVIDKCVRKSYGKLDFRRKDTAMVEIGTSNDNGQVDEFDFVD
ncbi:uncharacterized protein LOC103507650 [Diaphorina citri]|uniref:histone deacetylase n=1 Tax=Diaphorina citri TaxID=121845 RepID=A0A3Q0IV84_DIACI|nr:uncharacterized protein LOC103507650 [Diaphorina citri]